MTGDQLKITRKLKKLTQSDLGQLLGVHRTTIAEYENLAKLPDGLAEKFEELFGNLPKAVRPLSLMTASEHSKWAIPVFDVSFEEIENPSDLEILEPIRFYDIPKFAGCISFRINTESMKEIKPGTEVFARQVLDWESHLEYGKIYGIVCDDGRKYLKKIRKHHEDPKKLFLLKSTHSEFDDMDLPKAAIKSLWLVSGWLVQDI